jgi:hypothetical protein
VTFRLIRQVGDEEDDEWAEEDEDEKDRRKMWRKRTMWRELSMCLWLKHMPIMVTSNNYRVFLVCGFPSNACMYVVNIVCSKYCLLSGILAMSIAFYRSDYARRGSQH